MSKIADIVRDAGHACPNDYWACPGFPKDQSPFRQKCDLVHAPWEPRYHRRLARDAECSVLGNNPQASPKQDKATSCQQRGSLEQRVSGRLVQGCFERGPSFKLWKKHCWLVLQVRLPRARKNGRHRQLQSNDRQRVKRRIPFWLMREWNTVTILLTTINHHF